MQEGCFFGEVEVYFVNKDEVKKEEEYISAVGKESRVVR